MRNTLRFLTMGIFFLLVLGALIVSTSSEAQRRKRMTVVMGKDAVGFHLEYQGRRIVIDLDGPHVEHDWDALMDMVSADERVNLDVHLGRTRSVNNAFAFIRDGKRWIVLGTNSGGITPGNIYVVGHELGHHLCGHTLGEMQGAPHEKELEADRVAGVILGRFIQSGVFTEFDVVEEANRLIPNSFGPTHPEKYRRIAAIRAGIRTLSSSCLRPG